MAAFTTSSNAVSLRRCASTSGRSTSPLRFRFATLIAFIATVALSVALYAAMPQGFFPDQDTGILIGTTDATGHLVHPHVRFTAAGKCHRAAGFHGPLGGGRRRHQRRRPDRQQRPHVHHAQAMGSAEGQREQSHCPHRSQDGVGAWHPTVLAVGAGRARRRLETISVVRFVDSLGKTQVCWRADRTRRTGVLDAVADRRGRGRCRSSAPRQRSRANEALT
jgi:hypothetical protein